MITVKRLFQISVAAAILASAVPMPVGAQQISNQPVSIGRGGGTGGVGMSLGYRQAIIEEELLNKRPDALVRDATGALVEVERRRSGQAFVRGQASPFLPGASVGTSSGRGVRLSIGGVGIGFGGGGVLVGQATGGMVIGPLQATPIDSWIGQLYQGHNDAS